MIRRRDSAAASDRRSATWFAMPWLVGLTVFVLFPALLSLPLSFMSWDGLAIGVNMKWVGLDHYHRMAGTGDGALDPLFRTALWNSVVYTFMSVPTSLVVSLIIAMLLNSRLRGMGVFRTIVFLPYLLGGVATIVIWSWLLNPRFGLLNEVLREGYALLDPVVRVFADGGTSGWPTPNWFYSPSACKPALALMQVWLSGGSMLVFLAALQRVPEALMDACVLDGGGRWASFRHVTLPHISPALLFNLVIGIVFAMQAFDEAYLLYDRAQNDGLLFYMLHLYRSAFEPPYDLGYAAAMTWALLLVTVAFVVPTGYFSRRWLYEASRQ